MCEIFVTDQARLFYLNIFTRDHTTILNDHEDQEREGDAMEFEDKTAHLTTAIFWRGVKSSSQIKLRLVCMNRFFT